MAAERRKRAAVLESEGKREAAVNAATGRATRRLLAAEGERAPHGRSVVPLSFGAWPRRWPRSGARWPAPSEGDAAAARFARRAREDRGGPRAGETSANAKVIVSGGGGGADAVLDHGGGGGRDAGVGARRATGRAC